MQCLAKALAWSQNEVCQVRQFDVLSLSIRRAKFEDLTCQVCQLNTPSFSSCQQVRPQSTCEVCNLLVSKLSVLSIYLPNRANDSPMKTQIILHSALIILKFFVPLRYISKVLPLVKTIRKFSFSFVFLLLIRTFAKQKSICQGQ